VKSHIVEELPEYVLGTMAPTRAKSIERHLQGCVACSRASRALGRTADDLALSVARVAPPPASWELIRASLVGGARFVQFLPQLSEMYDLPDAALRPLLEKLLMDSAWEEGPAPGITVIPVNTGPKFSEAFSAFVKIPPGVIFPRHRHEGEELNLILQGGFRERGKDRWRGDFVREAAGSSHEQLGLPGVECLAATRLAAGMVLLKSAPRARRRSR
jgi:putative transcriptional regulator